MIPVNANGFRQALLLLLIVSPSVVLGDAGYDAKKAPAAMEGMDHNKMKMDSHGDVATEGHWMAPDDAAKRPNPIKASKASIARGKKLFATNCASCHGAAGKGDGPAGAALKPRPADLKAMAGRHPDGDFAWKIAEGRGPMPPWKKTLTENQIWDVVNFIQNLGGAGKSDHGHPSGHRH